MKSEDFLLLKFEKQSQQNHRKLSPQRHKEQQIQKSFLQSSNEDSPLLLIKKHQNSQETQANSLEKQQSLYENNKKLSASILPRIFQNCQISGQIKTRQQTEIQKPPNNILANSWFHDNILQENKYSYKSKILGRRSKNQKMLTQLDLQNIRQISKSHQLKSSILKDIAQLKTTPHSPKRMNKSFRSFSVVPKNTTEQKLTLKRVCFFVWCATIWQKHTKKVIYERYQNMQSTYKDYMKQSCQGIFQNFRLNLGKFQHALQMSDQQCILDIVINKNELQIVEMSSQYGKKYIQQQKRIKIFFTVLSSIFIQCTQNMETFAISEVNKIIKNYKYVCDNFHSTFVLNRMKIENYKIQKITNSFQILLIAELILLHVVVPVLLSSPLNNQHHKHKIVFLISLVTQCFEDLLFSQNIHNNFKGVSKHIYYNKDMKRLELLETTAQNQIMGGLYEGQRIQKCALYHSEEYLSLMRAFKVLIQCICQF